MTRLLETVKKCRELLQKQESVVRATLIHVSGSSYLKVGSMAIFSGGKRVWGLISGGCIEADLALRALDLNQGNKVQTCWYNQSTEPEDVFSFGTGCDGRLTVALEWIDASDQLLSHLLEYGDEFFLKSVSLTFEKTAQEHFGLKKISNVLDVFPVTSVGKHEDNNVLPETLTIDYQQSRVVHLVGGGADAECLVPLLKELGWRVKLFDFRREYLEMAAFESLERVYFELDDFETLLEKKNACKDADAWVVLTHHFAQDLDVLKSLAKLSCSYVGVLGSVKRASRLIEALSPEARKVFESGKIYLSMPVGLPLGGKGPMEVAVAIAAELLAFFNGKTVLKKLMHGFMA